MTDPTDHTNPDLLTPQPLAFEPTGWALALVRTFLPPVLFSAVGWFAAEVNYLVFHVLTELFSIVMAFTAMVVATSSARFARNHYIVFISVAVGWCAGIDLVHTLVFKGMHLLPDDSANPATQLWVAARYLQALALLVSPLALRRQFSPVHLHLAFGGSALVLIASVFFGHFPDAYIDGQGLTPFKIYSEFVIIALLLWAVVGLWRNRSAMSHRVFYSMVTAIVMMMLSEFAFTQYVSVYAKANLIGHILKIFSYWFVYLALVRDTIRDPFVQLHNEMHARQLLSGERELLLHNLGERIKELRCINAVSELVENPGVPLDDMLQKTAALLVPAFVAPDLVRIHIESEWGSFGVARPAIRPQRELVQPLLLEHKVVGTILVWYPDDTHDARAAFLPEEEGMMHNIARLLCDTIKRMHDAERVQRLRYLYEMSSATSRHVVHSRSRQELLDGLYDSLVAHGAFPILFLAETTEEGFPLRLIRQYGIPAEFLPSLSGLLHDHDSPLIEVLEAVRSGQVDSETIEGVYRGLALTHLPSLLEWRGFLQERGIIHRAVLPLRCSNRLEGVVVLYARGLTSFDDEQLRLLQEIAGEMGYALDSFSRHEQLIESEKQASLLEMQFQEVFKASPVPMQIMGIDQHRTRAINDAHRRWLGYELSEITLEDDWFRLAYHNGLEREQLKAHWQQSIDQARQGDPVESPELTLHCKDGSTRIARGRMTVVGQDAIVAWTDLTEIRRSEIALQESERRFRSMVEQTLAAMYVRRDGRYIYVNPSYTELTGWHVDELMGKPVLEFTSQDSENLEHIRRSWSELHDGTHKRVSYIVPFRRKDGQMIEIGLTAKIITWEDGAPATIVLATDITEQKRAEQQIAAYVKQLESAMRATLQAVSNMVEMRDPYTAGHERRVGLLASAIAREMGWSTERCDNLELLGLVHDIGKIAIPSEILTKPTRLTPLERQMMQGHVQAGYDILKDVPFPSPVAEIIRQHHERMDGSGYPRGLKGEDILPEARVLAVADVLESMASHRPYRPAVGLDAALAEVVNNRDKLYAPEVVDAAIRLIRDKGYALPT